MADLPFNPGTKEWDAYHAMATDAEKAGYLNYRAQEFAENPRRQGYRLPVAWAALDPQTRQGHIDAGADSGDESGSGGDEGGSGGDEGGEPSGGDPSRRDGGGSPSESDGDDHPSRGGKAPSGRGGRKDPPGGPGGEKNEDDDDDEEYNSSEYSYVPSPRERKIAITALEALDDLDAQDKVQRHPDRKWDFSRPVLYDTKEQPNVRFRTIVTLWEKCDAQSNVYDRVVVKRVRCEDKARALHLLGEVEKMERLPRCESFLRLRTHTHTFEQRNHILRLYTDYTPQGDLQKLMRFYLREHRKTQMPEAFIWLVFAALAEAIYAFNTGKCATTQEDNNDEISTAKRQGPPASDDSEDSEAPTRGRAGRKGKAAEVPRHERRWKYVMLHRDLKPQNIFLGAPIDPYNAYPNPIVADFDIAVFMDPSFDQHERKMTEEDRGVGGTDGWMPPEVLIPELGYDLSTKVDIWGAGMIIWELMHFNRKQYDYVKYAEKKAANKKKDNLLEENGYKPKKEGLRDWAAKNFILKNTDTFPSEEIVGWDAVYTQRLHTLVRKCLKTNPDERPGFVELRRQLKQEIRRYEAIMGPFSGPDAPATLPAHLFLQTRPEEIGKNVQVEATTKKRNGDGDIRPGPSKRRGRDNTPGPSKAVRRRGTTPPDPSQEEESDTDDENIDPHPTTVRKESKGKGRADATTKGRGGAPPTKDGKAPTIPGGRKRHAKPQGVDSEDSE